MKQTLKSNYTGQQGGYGKQEAKIYEPLARLRA